jgi:choline dehydrogenase
MDSFDYVIVGGGTSASVLANRLSAAGMTVCVLEAGPVDSNPFIHMPAGFVKTLFNPDITWQFQTEPTDWTAGRRIPTTQGRTLGGSGSINGQVFVRGQSGDYDAWARRGNPGWSYRDVLPYFRGIERRVGAGDAAYRGRDGELPVTDIAWQHPLCDAFMAGAASLGYALNPDYNAERTDGVGYYQRVIEGERRISAARAFLYPAMRRKELTVITGALVTAIVLEGRSARGVRYTRGGAMLEVRARREVIVCAGTVNSPKLLQLSGIGPGALLQSMGIEVRQDLAGVGANLGDHFSPRIVVRVKNTATINNQVSGLNLLGEGAKWLLRRPSVLGLSAAIMYAFGKSDPKLPTPDTTVIFTPASYRAGKLGSLDTYPGMTAGAWQMRPASLGHVRIQSADPHAAPLIQPNYLADKGDRRVLLAAIRNARRILATPSLAPYYEVEQLPGANLQSDTELLDFARQYGSSCYHLAGTCRMAPASDPTAVVDAELRVRGIENLRIADASIMPAVTSGNTYAPTLMIAAKAADLILGRCLAPAEHIAVAHSDASATAQRGAEAVAESLT